LVREGDGGVGDGTPLQGLRIISGNYLGHCPRLA